MAAPVQPSATTSVLADAFTVAVGDRRGSLRRYDALLLNKPVDRAKEEVAQLCTELRNDNYDDTLTLLHQHQKELPQHPRLQALAEALLAELAVRAAHEFHQDDSKEQRMADLLRLPAHELKPLTAVRPGIMYRSCMNVTQQQLAQNRAQNTVRALLADWLTDTVPGKKTPFVLRRNLETLTLMQYRREVAWQLMRTFKDHGGSAITKVFATDITCLNWVPVDRSRDELANALQTGRGADALLNVDSLYDEDNPTDCVYCFDDSGDRDEVRTIFQGALTNVLVRCCTEENWTLPDDGIVRFAGGLQHLEKEYP